MKFKKHRLELAKLSISPLAHIYFNMLYLINNSPAAYREQIYFQQKFKMILRALIAFELNYFLLINFNTITQWMTNIYININKYYTLYTLT